MTSRFDYTEKRDFGATAIIGVTSLLSGGLKTLASYALKNIIKNAGTMLTIENGSHKITYNENQITLQNPRYGSI